MALKTFFHTPILAAVVAAPLLLTSTNATAFASGAPSGACTVTSAYFNGMNSRTKNASAGNFTLSATSLTYVPGGPAIEITLAGNIGTTFAGINVVVTEEGTNTHAGTLAGQSAGLQVSSCGNGGRLTHTSNFGNQEISTFTWTPPATSVGPVAIKAYVLEGSRGSTASQEFYRLIEGDGALVLTAEEVDAGPGDVDAGPFDAGVEPEDDAGVEPEVDAGVEPEDDAGVEPEDDAGVEPEDDAGVEPEDDAGVEPEDDAGVEPEQRPETDAGVEPEPEPEGDAGTNEPEPEEDAGPGGETPGGCACDASPAPADGFALAAFALGLLAIRRRRRRSA